MRTDRTERPGGANKRNDRPASTRPPSDKPARTGKPADSFSKAGGERKGKPADSFIRADGERSGKSADGSTKPTGERKGKPRQEQRSSRDGGKDQVYGRNAVLAVLRGHRHVETIYISDTVGPDARIAEIKELAQHQHVSVQTVGRAQIENYIGKVNHQGVMALAERFAYTPLTLVIEQPGPILVLDHIADPQNLGTLLRAAAAFDIAGIVIPTDRAAEITPAVVNASAGAVESVQVARVVNLNRALKDIRDSGRWIVCLDGGEDSVSIFDAELPTPACLVLGNEGKGVSAQIRAGSDAIVRIPIGRKVESLNVATAGAMVLYELHRTAYLNRDTD